MDMVIRRIENGQGTDQEIFPGMCELQAPQNVTAVIPAPQLVQIPSESDEKTDLKSASSLKSSDAQQVTSITADLDISPSDGMSEICSHTSSRKNQNKKHKKRRRNRRKKHSSELSRYNDKQLMNQEHINYPCNFYMEKICTESTILDDIYNDKKLRNLVYQFKNTLPHHVLKTFEDLMQSIFHLLDIPDFSDWLNLMHTLIDSIGVRSRDAIDTILGYLYPIYRYFHKRISNLPKDLRTSLEYAGMIISSPIVSAIKHLVLSLVSLKWIGQTNAKWITSLIGKSRKMSYIDIIQSSIEHVLVMYKFVECIYRQESFSDIWFAESPSDKWISRAEELIDYYNRDALVCGLPVDGCMDARDHIYQSDQLIESSQRLIMELSPFDPRKSKIDGLLKILKLNASYSRIRFMQKKRRCPFGIVLHGDAGIGKSLILPLIYHTYFSVKNVKFDENMIFNRPKTSDYWTGYHPAAHPVVYYSETGAQSKKMALQKGDVCLDEILSLIDTNPFPCNMAEVDAKGKVFAAPELVAIDTNNPGMHIKDIMYSSAAVNRRFLFVHLIVKPEYRASGSTAIDVEKVAELENTLDAYHFRVYRKVPDANAGQGCVESNIREFFSVYDFVEELKSEFISHLSKPDYQNSAVYDFVYADDEIKEMVDVDIRSEASVNYAHWYCYVSSRLASYAETGSTTVRNCLNYIHMIRNDVHVISRNKFLEYASRDGNFPPPSGRKRQFWFKWIMIYLSLLLMLPMWVYYALFAVFLYFIVLGPSAIIGAVKAYIRLDPFMVRKRETERSYNHLRYLFGLEDYHPFEVSYIKLALISLSGAALLSYIYSHFKSKKVYSEASNLREYSEYNDKILDAESIVEAQPSKVRVKNKVHKNWTIVDVPVPLPPHKGDISEFYKFVSRNLFHVSVQANGKICSSKILGVCSSYALINEHSLCGTDNGYINVFPSLFPENTKPVSIHFTNEDIVKVTDDICMINLGGRKRFRNLLPHFFSKDVDYQSISGIVLGTSLVGRRFIRDVEASDENMGKIKARDIIFYQRDYVLDMCGSPFVGSVGKSSGICGIHFAGSKTSANRYAVVVTRERLEIAKSILDSRDICVPIFSEGTSIATSLPILRSPFLYEDSQFLQYTGKSEGRVLINNRSHVKPTKISPLLRGIFKRVMDFEPCNEYKPPLMKPVMRDGEYISPYNLAIRKMNTVIPCLNKGVLNKCIERFTHFIIEGLESKGVTSLSPLQMDEAINGAPCDQFLRRINLMTSCGFGFSGGKRVHLPIVYESLSEIVAEPNNDLKKRLVESIDSYINDNECSNFIFQAQLKDEPRLVEKVREGKTRVFYMTSLDNLILARMFLSPFYTSMVQYNDVFCTAVGIDMHRQADSFYHTLSQFSPYILEGDYAGFDVSNPLDISRAASTVIYNVCKHFGYNDKALLCVQGLLSDALYPYISMNLDLFVKPGMQPSGKYGTAEDNSLRGIIMLMYAWYLHEDLRDLDFFEYVLPRDYGDDILAAVDEKVVDEFNNHYYQAVCKEIYFMDFTSASKDKVMERFVQPSTMSFLKRTFHKSTDRNIMEARLDKNSIFKSLFWHIPSSSDTPLDQIIATCQSALWECYFWLNEKKYIKMRQELLSAVSVCYECPENLIADAFPTYYAIDSTLYPTSF